MSSVARRGCRDSGLLRAYLKAHAHDYIGLLCLDAKGLCVYLHYYMVWRQGIAESICLLFQMVSGALPNKERHWIIAFQYK